LQCAVREIGEETELVRTPVPTEHELVAIESVQKDLPFRLVRSGRPLHVPTARYDTTFVVHPFLFKISPSFADRIVIDWEHTGYSALIDPSILINLSFRNTIHIS